MFTDWKTQYLLSWWQFPPIDLQVQCSFYYLFFISYWKTKAKIYKKSFLPPCFFLLSSGERALSLLGKVLAPLSAATADTAVPSPQRWIILMKIFLIWHELLGLFRLELVTCNKNTVYVEMVWRQEMWKV